MIETNPLQYMGSLVYKQTLPKVMTKFVLVAFCLKTMPTSHMAESVLFAACVESAVFPRADERFSRANWDRSRPPCPFIALSLALRMTLDSAIGFGRAGMVLVDVFKCV